MHTTFNFLIYKKKNTKLIRIRYYYSTVKLLYILYEKKSMMKLMVVILAIYLLVIPTFGFKTPKNKHCEICLSTPYGNENTCAPFCKGGFDEIESEEDNYVNNVGFQTPKNKHCEMCLSTPYGNENTCAPFCKGGFDEIGNDNYENRYDDDFRDDDDDDASYFDTSYNKQIWNDNRFQNNIRARDYY